MPADITIECDQDDTDLTLTGDVTDEADNCSTGLDATYSDSVAAGACANESVITRTWTLTDECGNTTTADQTITIVDTSAPTFNETLPEDITVECDSIPEIDTLTAIDNCGTAIVTFTEVRTDGSCPSSYSLDRTWTATDQCGLTATHTQKITVIDTTAPVFNETLIGDISVECDAIPEADENSYTATDSCGDVSMSFEETILDGACNGDYIIERIWTATMKIHTLLLIAVVMSL